jgi:hypothetical protein
MASFVFGSASGINATQQLTSRVDVTITVPDSDIQVGDLVTLTGGDAAPGTGGVGDGDAYYLGAQNFGGAVGYVFGNADTIAGNGQTFFAVWDDEAPSNFTFVRDAFNFWARSNPTTLESNANACFAEGTMIATPLGEKAVEALQIGDLVTTADGRDVPVLWLGRQTVMTCFAGDRARLVRIAEGALDNHTELRVTADHGMIVDGLVINASALVNHDTIDWVSLADLPDRFTVYHIETAAHDVILANGAASETFIDYAGRQAFGNYAEYVELYGAERIIPEMVRPRISSARMLPDTLRARLSGPKGLAAA